MGMLYSVVKTKLPEKMLQDYYGWLENKYRSATLKSLCEWASQKSKDMPLPQKKMLKESTLCNKGRMQILIE